MLLLLVFLLVFVPLVRFQRDFNLFDAVDILVARTTLGVAILAEGTSQSGGTAVDAVLTVLVAFLSCAGFAMG